ncbi:MAG: hypothetical protein WCO54_03675 [Bacteroidota bacterium]
MNTSKILNIASFAFVIIGLYFKLSHWAGANVIIILSALTMLTTLFMFGFKDNKEAGIIDKLNYFLIGSIAFYMISMLFKILHWEGSDILVDVCYILAIMYPIVILLQKDDFKVSRQFFFTYSLFFLLMIGSSQLNPLANSVGNASDNSISVQESAAVVTDSSKTVK